jgi:predicted PurR-regulated permease PerM
MQRQTFNNIVLLTLVILISAVFISMIRHFLLALLMAGIFASLAQPVYRKLASLLGGRARAASVLTLLLFCFVVLIPLFGLITIITAQAVKVGAAVTPWVQQHVEEPGDLTGYLTRIPFYGLIHPFREQILSNAGEMVNKAGEMIATALSAGAIGTVYSIFMFFIFLYISYFFLIDGWRLLDRMLYFLPLEQRKKKRLLTQFTSVTRATLKGTAVIGVLQGTLEGLGFAVVGIESAVFWGAVMAILSMIPILGSALIWIPAAIMLAAGGSYLKALGLAVYCGIVVGSLDNVVRPRWIGRDTQMHDLMVFLGILGGISLFGPLGLIVGPIVASLFVTVWDLFGEVAEEVMPGSTNKEEPADHPDPPGQQAPKRQEQEKPRGE